MGWTWGVTTGSLDGDLGSYEHTDGLPCDGDTTVVCRHLALAAHELKRFMGNSGAIRKPVLRATFRRDEHNAVGHLKSQTLPPPRPPSGMGEEK